ncbi:cysteine proteinase, partial [Aureobasidium pullulans]
FQSSQQASNQGRKPSADEIRLFPGTYPYATPTLTREPRRLTPSSQTEDSNPIHVPKEDWNNMNNTRRKPLGSKIKPANTLNRAGPGANSLPTYSSRGINVEEPSIKRQKTSHGESDEEYFNRSVQEQPSATFGRRSSITSLNSQSQDASSHSQKHNGFRQTEAEGVHRTLNARPKRGRKPKTGLGQASSPFSHGTDNDPVTVEDDDDLQIVGEQTATPRSARRVATRQTPLPNAAQITSNQVRSNNARDTIEVDSAFHRNRRAEEKRKSALTLDHVEILVQPRKASVATPVKRNLSPRMGESFVRDRGASPAPQQNQAKIREKMQSTSNTTRFVQPRQVDAESSEDELSRDPAASKSARRSSRAKRSPSPNHIIASEFFAGGRENAAAPGAIDIPLSYLRIKGGNWKNVHLLYSYRYKLIQFTQNDENLHIDAKMIQLASNHAQTVMFTVESSNGIILTGSKGNGTTGRIWLQLANAKDLDKFLNAIKHMNEKCNLKQFDERQFGKAREFTETFLTPVSDTNDPELQAMKLRQDTVSKPMTERERNIAIQKGTLLSESEVRSPTPRKSQMRAEFTNRPATDNAVDYSLPPPTSRVERVTTTRSSQRLQTKVGGKAAQASEPELVRWTHVNGIPDWDGPLTYPFTGTNRTTVDAEDIARLDDGELLNDNLISFCLRDMEENNPELKDKAHIFNSFFYERLTTMGTGKKGFNYEAVSRWTRTKDLFSLPFVAVPINTQFHWFLVIICNLDQLERKLSLDGLENDQEEKPEAESSSTAQEPAQSQSTVQNEIEIPESPQEPKDIDLSQGVKRISLDASQDQEGEFPAASKLKATQRRVKKQGPPPQKIDPTTPALLLLDSLGGSHPQEIRNLKQYAVHEGREKRGLEFKYTELKGMTARGLPQQTNFCDCGVYLIGYMEAFLRDPHGFALKVMSRELDHNNDFADFDPSKKRAEIRERLIKLHEEQTHEKKRKKKETHLAKMAAKRNSETKSATVTPAQMSSPMKPPAAYDTSRMVQSSPMKPRPKQIQMQKPSPPVPPSTGKTLATSDRDADEDMLFNPAFERGDYNSTSTAPSSRGSHSHTQHDFDSRSNNQPSNNQPSNIRSGPSFIDELNQAIREAGQVEEIEE